MKNAISVISIAIAALFSLQTSPLYAQNLVSNGAFEQEGPLDGNPIAKQYNYVENGFDLDFDASRWIEGWIINGAVSPAKISFGERDNGSRTLKVLSKGESHIYPAKPLPAGEPYKVTFEARGAGNKEPKVIVYAYYYGQDGWLKNAPIKAIVLKDEWSQYTVDVPAEGPEGSVNLRIVYAFIGDCEFANVEVTRKD